MAYGSVNEELPDESELRVVRGCKRAREEEEQLPPKARPLTRIKTESTTSSSDLAPPTPMGCLAEVPLTSEDSELAKIEATCRGATYAIELAKIEAEFNVASRIFESAQQKQLELVQRYRAFKATR